MHKHELLYFIVNPNVKLKKTINNWFLIENIYNKRGENRKNQANLRSFSIKMQLGKIAKK